MLVNTLMNEPYCKVLPFKLNQTNSIFKRAEIYSWGKKCSVSFFFYFFFIFTMWLKNCPL